MEQGSAELLGREAFPAGAELGWERIRDERTAQKPQRSLGAESRTEAPEQWKMFAFFIPEKVASAVLKRRIGSPPEARAESLPGESRGQRGLAGYRPWSLKGLDTTRVTFTFVIFLVIRGDKDEQAVLCSEDKTYDLKVADTSNMLLFIPGCKIPEQLKMEETHCNLIQTEIFGFSNNYWELRRCRPKLKKLKKLLMENTYEGPDSEKEKDSSHLKYTTEDLLDQIQASEEEIMTQLQVLNACEIGGYWRILEFDYEMKLLNHITQLVDSESWSFSKVPLNTCLQELGPLEPEEMIEHCLRCYGKKYTEEGEVYFELSADKICRATAQMLLQNAVKFNLAEFQEVWQQSVPEGMTARLDQLQGLALVDRQSRPEIIFLLKAEDLPEGDQERFSSLFSLREKWTEEDIAPYIQDLCGEKQTVGALLTKYARSSMQNGVKVYNSRRPIS
ncbi:sister chromatid cohesion protein DCC1 [Oryx dammah]|uniref:sister chromatid cohesion protein DCC1 n=1 Tax=Oryx dammah TaxID=59534 RepID=UPI001A9A7921|nr:sister chromatid cohesion protein DCC1 [Oryx dammah]